MDSVIFTLYNYASNQREEYLLLRLFQTALQEEIKYVAQGQLLGAAWHERLARPAVTALIKQITLRTRGTNGILLLPSVLTAPAKLMAWHL